MGKKVAALASDSSGSPKIAAALHNLPTSPGVYEMLNAENETLYVGKAKNLRKRVQSYFRESANLSARIRKMLEKTVDLSWTEVSSEVEALILETNLIKEKQPKFNILMRDDKNFAYFCVTMAEDFPRVLLTRRIVRDGSLYFGPKTSAGAVRQTIDLLQDIFLFRSTDLTITEESPGQVTVKNPGNIRYPCLNFHIGKCRAPCIGNISKEEYRTHIAQVIRFLRGDTKAVERDLEESMRRSAENKEFEKAARLRDLYLAVKNISEKQVVSAPDEFSADVIGTVEKFGSAFFHLFQIREGKVLNSETFHLSLENAEDVTESLYAFLREHADRAADFPKHLVLSGDIFPAEEVDSWTEFFTEKWGQKIQIDLPQKGKRQKLLALAEQNAASYALRNAASFIKAKPDMEKTFTTLREKLHMERDPERIECFDISHLGGTETVASMTVFIDGVAKPAEYRRFQLRSIEHGEINDFKSMEEVLWRRLRHIPRQLPEGYTLQKIISKSDFAQCQKILEEEKILFPEGADQTFFVLKKEKTVRALLGVSAENGEEVIRACWTHPEDAAHELVHFLLQKLLEISGAKKILLAAEVQCIPPEILEQFGFVCEENTWVYKNLKKKKKGKESLDAIPDLIVIDGGKGQLSSANTILQKFPFADRITICSLAKRLEEIYVPGQSAPLAITADAPEGKLLQQIRDEAHRFAVSYHKKLHEKAQQKSALDEIPGIGPQTKKKLLKAFGSVSGIKEATDEEVEKVVGLKMLQMLRKSL